MITPECTEACAATPQCTVCHKTKHPRGRDPGLVAANSYCEHECAGNREPPLAGHLWPNEWREHLEGRSDTERGGREG